MITAVALPAIVTDLASWTRLREASWIINGYLLVYVVTMPVAGRLADLYGARRLFLWALAIFTLGSFLAGAAPSLELLIVARLVQAVGGGALVPVATSAASHLFTGASRPRALGVVGALTFLGMAAGPVLGRPSSAPSIRRQRSRAWGSSPNRPLPGCSRQPGAGCSTSTFRSASGHWWWPGRQQRLGDAATPGPRRPRRAILFSAPRRRPGRPALLGSQAGPEGGIDPATVPLVLLVVALIAGPATIVRGLRVTDPFLDPRLFRSASFSSAALVSLLTGYGFATAIVGAAVFVDRVLYGGPDEQRMALGALAGATAVGAYAPASQCGSCRSSWSRSSGWVRASSGCGRWPAGHRPPPSRAPPSRSRCSASASGSRSRLAPRRPSRRSRCRRTARPRPR